MIRWWLEVLAIFLPTKGWSFGAWIKCQVAAWRACSWFSTSTAADRLKLMDELWRTSINLSNLSCFLTKIYHSYHLWFFCTLSTFSIHIALYLRWNQLCIRQSWCEVGFTGGGGMLSGSSCETHWDQCITSEKQLVKVTLESYSLMNHSYQMGLSCFLSSNFPLDIHGTSVIPSTLALCLWASTCEAPLKERIHQMSLQRDLQKKLSGVFPSPRTCRWSAQQKETSSRSTRPRQGWFKWNPSLVFSSFFANFWGTETYGIFLFEIGTSWLISVSIVSIFLHSSMS